MIFEWVFLTWCPHGYSSLSSFWTISFHDAGIYGYLRLGQEPPPVQEDTEYGHCMKYVMRPLFAVHSFLFHFCYTTHKGFSRALEIAYFYSRRTRYDLVGNLLNRIPISNCCDACIQQLKQDEWEAKNKLSM